jgi:SHS2 domain-containing protein
MFELFEHKADMGVRGTGKTMEKAFSEAAAAMMSIMVEQENVEGKEKFLIEAEAGSHEKLFVAFLNEILYVMDYTESVMKAVEVDEINEKGGGFLLRAHGTGEKKSGKHEFITEVKAASYSQLAVKKEGNLWIAQCIVDV